MPQVTRIPVTTTKDMMVARVMQTPRAIEITKLADLSDFGPRSLASPLSTLFFTESNRVFARPRKLQYGIRF